MLMLDLWLQAETPGVTHFGAYHRPPDGHFYLFHPTVWCGNFSSLFRVVKSAESQLDKFYGGNSNSEGHKTKQEESHLFKGCDEFCITAAAGWVGGRGGLTKTPLSSYSPTNSPIILNNLSSGFWIIFSGRHFKYEKQTLQVSMSTQIGDFQILVCNI